MATTALVLSPVVIVRPYVLLLAGKLVPAGHFLVDDQAFESVQPVVVIPFAGVVFAATLGVLESCTQSSRPLVAGYLAGIDEFGNDGEGLCLPRLPKHRSIFVTG